MNRHRFDISGSSSAFSDTGPHINGAILQMRWYPTTADTGGDLAIDLMPSTDPNDTGFAWTFFNDNDCLGAAFTKVPTQPMHHSDGFDTGASGDVPIVAAGERLRVRITPGGSSIAGKLWVWWVE
jgi:hypothetical protein